MMQIPFDLVGPFPAGKPHMVENGGLAYLATWLVLAKNCKSIRNGRG
jgi:hypothetical protein